jgi:hypothetical protein
LSLAHILEEHTEQLIAFSCQNHDAKKLHNCFPISQHINHFYSLSELHPKQIQLSQNTLLQQLQQPQKHTAIESVNPYSCLNMNDITDNNDGDNENTPTS